MLMVWRKKDIFEPLVFKILIISKILFTQLLFFNWSYAAMTAQIPKSCLVLLCGIPAAGKTYVSSALKMSLLEPSYSLKAYFESLLGFCPVPCAVNYDDIEKGMRMDKIDTQDDELLSWHLARFAAYDQVDRILREDGHNMVIVDDNFYYRSMRYKYCQLARKHRIGIITIKVECDVSKALSRNAQRDSESRVKPEVIERMARLFEDSDENSTWEDPFIRINSDQVVDFETLEPESPWKSIVNAWLRPRQPSYIPEEHQKELQLQRARTLNDFIHQADLAMRQIISFAAKSWQHDSEDPSNRPDLAQFMQASNNARKRFISAVRSGDMASLFTTKQEPVEASRRATATTPQSPRMAAAAPAAAPTARDADKGSENAGPRDAGWWEADWREEDDDGRAALRALLAAQFRKEVARLRVGCDSMRGPAAR